MKEDSQFSIKKCEGDLDQRDLEAILDRLPIVFFTVDINSPRRTAFQTHEKGEMEVYHSARVISIYPPNGKRISCATVIKPEFPLRSDNIMDDQLGLRCCYHPKLEDFGIEPRDSRFGSEIEIDIFKHPKGNYS